MSTIPQSHYPLIEMFFGADAVPTAARGVEALLGIQSGERRAEVIFQALNTRLAALAAHPRGASPEAGIVRLCLQASAMQLISPLGAGGIGVSGAPAGLPEPREAPIRPVAPPAAELRTEAPIGPQPLAPAPPTSPPPLSPRPESSPVHAPAPAPRPAMPAPAVAPASESGLLSSAPDAGGAAISRWPTPARQASAPLREDGVSAAPIPPTGPFMHSAAPTSPGATDALVSEASRLIAIGGGITPDVVKQIAMLAMARGLPASAAEQVLARVSGGPGVSRPGAAAVAPPPQVPSSSPSTRMAPAGMGTRGPVAPAGPAPAASLFEPERDDGDQGTRLLKAAVYAALGIFVASIGLIVGGAILISNVPPAAPVVEVSPVAPAPAPVAAPKQPEDEWAQDIPDAAAVVRAVRSAADLAGTDRAQSLKALERAVPAFAAWWPKMDVGQRAAAMSHLVDAFLRLAPEPDLAPALIDLVAAGAQRLGGRAPLQADEVVSSAWSVGALARLAGEQNLPAVVRLRLQTAAGGSLMGSRLPASASFQAGAAIALRRMPLRIIGDGRSGDLSGVTTAMARWEQAIRQLYGASAAEQAAAEGAIVEGLERLIIGAPEPDESRAVYDAITLIAGKLRWRQGDPSRSRLISWFDDRRVSMSDLATVTAAIVTRSGAEGIDSTMTLPPSATGEGRLQLRDAYAGAWGLVTRGAAAMNDDWLRVAREELGVAPPTDQVAALDVVALYARLNEAAWRRHRGDAQGAADILVHDVLPRRRANMPPPAAIFVLPKGAAAADGVWTARYLSTTKGLPNRVERLRELEPYAPFIGPIDADTLAEVAMLGGGEVRSAAMKLVTAFGSSADVVNGVLKYLPRAGRSAALAKCLTDLTGQSLGPWNAERFPLLARRALVEKALELMAADGPTRQIDGAVARLADAYEGMAAERSEGGVSESEGGVRAAAAATRLHQVLVDQAVRTLPHEHAPVSLDEIRLRREARLAVSRGLVQRFAAEQLACAELLALVASTERPARAAELRTVLESIHAGHRDARDVQSQLIATEAGMLRLWFIRFGEETPP
ncbi:MAG: hypothetical protein AB7K52_02565 [Phycisphaerales bacterium]